MLAMDKRGVEQLPAIRRLARGLCVQLRLPRDNSLAFIIGSGAEATNEAAVVSWLRSTGVSPNETTFDDACEALRSALRDKLGEA